MGLAEQVMLLTVIGISTGSLYSLIAIGYVLVFSTTQVINFAQGEFVMIGALVTYSLYQTGLPLAIACLGAVACVAVIGLLMHQGIILKAKAPNIIALFLITLGGSTFLRAMGLIIWGKERYTVPPFVGDIPIHFLGLSVVPQNLIIMGTMLLLVIGLFIFLQYTLVGKAMQACAIDEWAARLMGIRTKLMMTLCFIMAGILGAVGGIVIMPLTFANFNMGVLLGLKGFVAAAMGGLTNIGIAVAGGLILGVVESLFGGLVSSAYKDSVALIILVATLLAREWWLLRKVRL